MRGHTHPSMAHPIPADDREHFAAVQQALAEDGLHVAMASADPAKLHAYAGELARAIAGTRGWHVEAYRASRLESVVADLMLHRFDAALSRISGSPSGRTRAAAQSPDPAGYALFIPDAQAMPLPEFKQLLRVAAGTRRLRLIALFDDRRPLACAAHLRAMGTQVAHWSLDDEDEPAPASSRTGPAARAHIAHIAHIARLPHPARPLRLGAAGLAAAAALLLALLPAAQWHPADGHAGTTATASTLTRSGLVQLAGEPPADVLRKSSAAGTADDTEAAP